MLTLIPRDVFVGDTAELIYSFIPDTSFLDLLNAQEAQAVEEAQAVGNVAKVHTSGTENITISIPTDHEVFSRISDLCTIVDASVEFSSSECVVHISFVPWVSGALDFAPFDMMQIATSTQVGASTQADTRTQNQASFIIDIPEVTIASIIDKTERNTLQQTAAPVLVPGTIYAVYGGIAFLVFLFTLLIVSLVRIKKIRKNVKNFWLRIHLPARAGKALKTLKKLQKNIACHTAESYADALSLTLRAYLQERFSYPFTSAVTSELPGAFATLTADSADSDQSASFDAVYGLCVRLDYLRFSGVNDSTDSLWIDEMISQTNRIRSLILYFEGRKPLVPLEEADDATL